MSAMLITEPERQLLEHVASLARSLHAERERLAARLTELERELCVLATTLDGRPAVIALGGDRQPRG